MGEKLQDWKAAAKLVRRNAENYKLPYYTMSQTYSVCRDHGYLTGEQYTCPVCGKKTEVYSRITGYYRPVQNWNDGKAQEFKDRKVYNIGRSTLTHVGPRPAMSNADAAMEAAFERPCCEPAQPLMKPEAEDASAEKLDTVIHIVTPIEEKAAAKPAGTSGAILFKTPTCPNCKAAMALLDRAGIQYTALNANEEKELVEKYGVKQAPTLVLVDGDRFEKFRGVSDIKGWLMQRV